MVEKVRVSNSEISPPEGGGGLINDLAREIKNRACGLYRNIPETIVPNPASKFLRKHWNEFCDDTPDFDPPSPEIPFQGGQCPCELYDVTVTASWTTTDADGGNESDLQTRTATKTFQGKIGELIVSEGNGNQVLVTLLHSVDCPSPEGSDFQGRYFTEFYGGRRTKGLEARIINIVRADGEPDTCGDPPERWRPDYRAPEDIPLPPIEIPPPSSPSPGNDFNLSIPLIFAPISNVNAPRFNLGGIDVRIDLGGMDFSLPGDPGDLIPEFDGLPPFFAPLPDNADIPEFPDIPDYQEDLDSIGDKLDELLEEGEEPADEPGVDDIQIFWKEGSCENGEFSEEEKNGWISPKAAGDFVRQKELLFNIAKESCYLEQVILDNPGIGATPDYWHTKIGADRKLMLIIFRRDDSRTYYTMTIPHPVPTVFEDTSPISNFQGGDYMVRETLRDNSKVVCNCIDEATALSIHSQMVSLIDPNMRFSPPKIFKGMKEGQGLNTSLRRAKRWEYLPEGLKSSFPTASGKFKEVEN